MGNCFSLDIGLAASDKYMQNNCSLNYIYRNSIFSCIEIQAGVAALLCKTITSTLQLALLRKWQNNRYRAWAS